MKKAIGYLFWGLVAGGIGFYVRSQMMPGGSPAGPPARPPMPPAAVVGLALKERALDTVDEYIAMVEPVQAVTVRSEVAGYIDQVHFQEGAFVKEGTLLFTIDRKKYEAQVNVGRAELASARAELERAEKYLKRMQEAGSRSISQTELDTAESSQLQAAATFKQAEANLNLAQIDLDYSQIRAPISGRIGAAKLTKGNYVTAGSDALAQIVQTNPVRIVFSMTDRDYLTLRQQEIDGTANGLVARIRMPNGAQIPTVGKKDFDDNTMNPETGTLAVRYLFDNPDGLLVSGGYVNIQLGQAERPMGLCIPQKAVLLDPKGSYVLTVQEGKASMARVQLGKVIGSDQVVLSGLNVGDVVIVEGVQKARPGMPVNLSLQEGR